jgi:hypothetical protein
MGMTQSDDDKDDPKWEWPHPADLGPILIAGVFMVAMISTFLWLFSSPDPFADLFGHKPAAAQSDNGEVMIDLQQKPQKK